MRKDWATWVHLVTEELDYLKCPATATCAEAEAHLARKGTIRGRDLVWTAQAHRHLRALGVGEDLTRL
jgi:hypothetical protein